MTRYKQFWLAFVLAASLFSPVNAQASMYFWAVFRQQYSGLFTQVGYTVLRVLDSAATGSGSTITRYFIPTPNSGCARDYSQLTGKDAQSTQLKSGTSDKTGPSGATPKSSSGSFSSSATSPADQSSYGSAKTGKGSWTDVFKKPSGAKCEKKYASVLDWEKKFSQTTVSFIDAGKHPIDRKSAAEGEDAINFTSESKPKTKLFSATAFFMTLLDIVQFAMGGNDTPTEGHQASRQDKNTEQKVRELFEQGISGHDPLFGVFCRMSVMVTSSPESPYVGFIFSNSKIESAPLTILQPLPANAFPHELLLSLDDHTALLNEFSAQAVVELNLELTSHGGEDPAQFLMEGEECGDQSPDHSSPDPAPSLETHQPTAHSDDVPAPQPVENLPPPETQGIARNPQHPFDFSLHSPVQHSSGASATTSGLSSKKNNVATNYEMAFVPLHLQTPHLQASHLPTQLHPDSLETPDEDEPKKPYGDWHVLTNANLRWIAQHSDDINNANLILKQREIQFEAMSTADLEIIVLDDNEPKWRKQAAKEELQGRRKFIIKNRDSYEAVHLEHQPKKDDGDDKDGGGGASLSGLSTTNSGGTKVTYHQKVTGENTQTHDSTGGTYSTKSSKSLSINFTNMVPFTAPPKMTPNQFQLHQIQHLYSDH